MAISKGFVARALIVCGILQVNCKVNYMVVGEKVDDFAASNIARVFEVCKCSVKFPTQYPENPVR
jgi:hypothetical protein